MRWLLLFSALLLRQVGAAPTGHLVVAVGTPDRAPGMVSVDVVSGQVEALTSTIVSLPRVGPDGHHVLYAQMDGGAHRVHLLDLREGRETAVTPGAMDAFPICWMGSSAFLATEGVGIGGTTHVYRVPLAGGSAQRVANLSWCPVVGGVSADRRTFYFQDGSEAEIDSIKAMTLSNGHIRPLLHGFAPRLSPDGRWLVYVDTDAKALSIWSPATRQVRRLAHLGATRWMLSPTFSPDGSTVAWLSGPVGGNSAEVDMVTLDGRRLPPIALPDTADWLDWAR